MFEKSAWYKEVQLAASFIVQHATILGVTFSSAVQLRVKAKGQMFSYLQVIYMERMVQKPSL